MPRSATVADVLAAVAALGAESTDRTCWVGVDGFGGAGKSTLAAVIAAATPRAVVVPVDDFWSPSTPEWDWLRFRRQVLAPLRAGEDARYRRWDWDAGTEGDWVELPAGRVVVVEGVSATRTEAGVPWDLTVWVDAPRDVRLARALDRDGPATMARWLTEWLPSEEAYAARERPQLRVDLIVSSVPG
jgi:uridine kinase